jgi:hypothetical protein
MAGLKELLVELVDRARASGRVVTIDSPATPDAIADLESRCGALSGHVRELVQYAAGFSVDELAVRFLGEHPFEFEGVFRCGIPIATDGAGNFWVVDVGADGSWRSVFFVAHDPPVVLVQARDLGAFIDQVFERPGRELTRDEAVVRIWKDNPHAMARAEAVMSSDPAVRAFAQQLGDGFVVVDLRAGREGTGFPWGSAGPKTEVRRAGDDLLFAVEQKKRGALARLFPR